MTNEAPGGDEGSVDETSDGGNPPTVNPPTSTPSTSGDGDSKSVSDSSKDPTSPSQPSAPTNTNSECIWEEKVLPRWLMPKEYSITLDLDIENLQELNGVVEITIEVVEDTNCVILNAGKNVQVSKVSIKDDDIDGDVSVIEDNSQLAIKFPSILPGPEAILVLEYKVEYSSDMLNNFGPLYINKNDDNGKTSNDCCEPVDVRSEVPRILSTHFQDFGAHEIIPCFDEYDMPAIHTLSLIVSGDFITLSNMPPYSTKSMDGRKTKYEFSSTPVIPTSLLAFSVGEFLKVSRSSRLREGQVDLRVWGHEGITNMKETTAYLEKILQEFEIKLNQAYTLPKIDFVSSNMSPIDSGSMGLFYINENALYEDIDAIDATQFAEIASGLGYPTSQFWFGNIVQTKEREYKFLKDSLATYFQYIGAEAALPENDWFHKFYVHNSFAAIAIDDGEGPPPIVVEDGTFQSDLILKNKGASLIRMLRTFYLRASEADGRVLGSDVVINGLQDYLREHKMSTASPSDLWRVMRETSGDDIDLWMEHWITTPGVPIIHVIKEGNDVYVKQSPLLTPKCDDSGSMWIPIQYKTKNNPTPRWKVLQKCGPEIMVTLESSEDSAIVNVGGVGYYRAHYHWDILDSWRVTPSNPNSVLDSILNPLDLAVFLSDSLGCNEVGKYTINIFMDFASALALRQDMEYSPWKIAIENFGKIRNLIRNSDNICAEKLSLHVRDSMLDPMLSLIKDTEVGDNDSLDLRLLRAILLNAAMEFGDTSRLSYATSSIATISNVHLDLRNSVYRGAIRVGDNNMFDNILNKGKSTDNNMERKRLFTSLIYSQDKSLLLKMWEFAMNDEYMGIHDVLKTARDSKGAPNSLLFDIILETYDDIKRKRGENIYHVISDLLLELSRSITNESHATYLETLSDTHTELQSAAKEVSRVVSRNKEWVLKNMEPLCDWLDNV